MIRIGMKLLLAVLGIAAAASAAGQSYPTKPVRILVPFSAGSSPDLVARLVAEKAALGLGQPVIVENRIGAGGRIAAEAAKRAAPDGYTLLLGSVSTHIASAFLVKNLPYDPVNDFVPILNAVSPVSSVMLNASVPAHSMKEFVDYARAHPGKIAYGSNGIGSTHHFIGELIKLTAGIDLLHVPLAGSNEVMQALVSNQIQLSFNAAGPAQQYLASGRIRMLAILPGERYAGLPNVPTLAEALPGYETIEDWFGFFGPAGLPRPIVSRLHDEMVKALNAPDVRTKLDNMTMVVIASTPEQFAAQMKREAALFAKVARAIHLEPR